MDPDGRTLTLGPTHGEAVHFTEVWPLTPGVWTGGHPWWKGSRLMPLRDATYDAMDRVASMTYPDGEVVNYTYNNQLLLATMTGWSQYITGTNYNALGKPTSVSYNGVVTTMGYHSQTLRLTSVSVPSPVNLSLGYEHLPNGNISRITQGSPINCGYDHLDRLTSAGAPINGSYSFSQIGNLMSPRL